MRDQAELMTSEQVKAWIMRQNFPPAPWDLPLDERIADSLREFGCDRVRVTQTLHHPVFRVSGRFGRFTPPNVRALNIAIRKMGRALDFPLSIRDIVVEVYAERFVAVFALLPPEGPPEIVENDGEWVPEHVEVPA